MAKIALVINADTRPPMDSEVFTVGDDGGSGSLHGIRHWDLLGPGVEQKIRFFLGYELQVVIYIDIHLPIPKDVRLEMEKLVTQVGNDSVIVECAHERSLPHWNDCIYLNALRMADAEYICHMDQDANALSAFPCVMVDRFIETLRRGECKFVCQPSDMHPKDHGMWWASTRFFMCKRETLDIPTLEAAVDNPMRIFEKYPSWEGATHLPCFEHLLGVIAGQGGVFYPPRNDDEWIVWSWARYRKGLLKRLNEMTYADAKNYIVNVCGLCGPNDCLATAELP